MIAVGTATLKVKAKCMDEAARIALDQVGDLEFRHESNWEDFEIGVPVDGSITCRTANLISHHERDFVVEINRYNYGRGYTSYAVVSIASPRLTVLLPATYHNDNIGPFNIVGFSVDDYDLLDLQLSHQALTVVPRANTIGMNYTLKWGWIEPDEVDSDNDHEVLAAYNSMTSDTIGATESDTMEVWMVGGLCTLQPKAYVGVPENRVSTHLDIRLDEVEAAYLRGAKVLSYWEEY